MDYTQKLVLKQGDPLAFPIRLVDNSTTPVTPVLIDGTFSFEAKANDLDGQLIAVLTCTPYADQATAEKKGFIAVSSAIDTRTIPLGDVVFDILTYMDSVPLHSTTGRFTVERSET